MSQGQALRKLEIEAKTDRIAGERLYRLRERLGLPGGMKPWCTFCNTWGLCGCPEPDKPHPNCKACDGTGQNILAVIDIGVGLQDYSEPCTCMLRSQMRGAR